MVLKSKFAIAALVTPLIFFETVVIDLLNAVLPDIGAYFSAPASTVQYIVSLFLLGYAISQMIMGPLSDRLGRKCVLVGSLVLIVLCHLAAAMAGDIDILIFSRFLLGLFAGACLSVCLAVIRDIYGEDRMASVLSHIYSIAGIASILCGLLGGLIGEYWGWRVNFYALALYFAVLLILVALLIPETRKENQSVESLGEWFDKMIRLLRQRNFAANCAASGLAYAGMLTMIALSAFVWSDAYGMGARAIGTSFAIVIASYSIGAQFAAHRERFGFGVDRAIRAGLWLLLISSFAALAFRYVGPLPLWGLNAALFVYVMAVGMAAPLFAAKIIGPNPDLAGTAAGILTCSGLLLCSLCAAIAGAFYAGNAVSMLVVMGINAALALAFFKAANN